MAKRFVKVIAKLHIYQAAIQTEGSPRFIGEGAKDIANLRGRFHQGRRSVHKS
jgi:hypothetical protein